MSLNGAFIFKSYYVYTDTAYTSRVGGELTLKDDSEVLQWKLKL